MAVYAEVVRDKHNILAQHATQMLSGVAGLLGLHHESQLDSAADPRISLALGFLSAPTNALPVADAARKLNLSISRLRHIFQEGTGVPLARYLKHQRLAQARVLFETTFLSVKEVMDSVGIGDLSHGLRDYKVKFGETPSESRNLASERVVPAA